MYAPASTRQSCRGGKIFEPQRRRGTEKRKTRSLIRKSITLRSSLCLGVSVVKSSLLRDEGEGLHAFFRREGLIDGPLAVVDFKDDAGAGAPFDALGQERVRVEEDMASVRLPGEAYVRRKRIRHGIERAGQSKRGFVTEQTRRQSVSLELLAEDREQGMGAYAAEVLKLVRACGSV